MAKLRGLSPSFNQQSGHLSISYCGCHLGWESEDRSPSPSPHPHTHEIPQPSLERKPKPSREEGPPADTRHRAVPGAPYASSGSQCCRPAYAAENGKILGGKRHWVGTTAAGGLCAELPFESLVAVGLRKG